MAKYSVSGLPHPDVRAGNKDIDDWVNTLAKFIRRYAEDPEAKAAEDVAVLYLNHYNAFPAMAWAEHYEAKRQCDIEWRRAYDQRLAAEREGREANAEAAAKAKAEQPWKATGFADLPSTPTFAAEPSVEPVMPTESDRPDDGTWEWAAREVYWRFDRRALIAVLWVVAIVLFFVWLATSG